MNLIRNTLQTRRRLLTIVVVVVVLYVTCNFEEATLPENGTRAKRERDQSLEETLQEDKGTGCVIPKIDPFAEEIMKLNKTYPPLRCGQKAWVRCYLSKCKLDSDLLKKTIYVQCSYREMIYETDFQYSRGPATILTGPREYYLTDSDYVEIYCKAKIKSHKKRTVFEYIIGTPNYYLRSWFGYALGLRPVEPPRPPAGIENNINVLIFCFDSTSRNAFIRHMPKSLKFLKEMNAVVLDNYNIVADASAGALFPLLTGRSELELPEYRHHVQYSAAVDHMSFIFHKLKKYGYRTAYFEDMPNIGTFQFYFNGFRQQPADHYPIHYFGAGLKGLNQIWHCAGGRPLFQVMVNITDQFLQLDGKKYVFTIAADITHDVNQLGSADEPFAEFLSGLVQQGRHKNTLIVVMGDHGPRYADIRFTYQGIFEERLPFLAIRLPEELTEKRPNIQAALESNAGVLATPHDVHATILDALDLRQHWNRYKVKGADLLRGLTLLEPIPKNRSCSEAGIESHWCTCLQWAAVDVADAMYERAARALVDHINGLTDFLRSKCVIRTLTAINWVNVKKPTKAVLKSSYMHRKNQNARREYQIKITVGPGNSVFEATVTHLVKENSIIVSTSSISRTNSYNKEPACISATYPSFNKFCYCH